MNAYGRICANFYGLNPCVVNGAVQSNYPNEVVYMVTTTKKYLENTAVQGDGVFTYPVQGQGREVSTNGGAQSIIVVFGAPIDPASFNYNG